MREWLPIETAPKDGSQFDAKERSVDRLTGRLRTIKATCFRAEGQWCRYWRRDIIYWHPTHWKPKTA